VAPASFDTMTGAFGSYNFTWIPIAVTLAALAAIPLLLMLLFRVVPLLSIDEIEEIEEIEEINLMKNAVIVQSRTPGVPVGDDESLVGATGKAHRVAGATGVLLLVALLGVLGVGAAAPAEAATSVKPGTISITGIEAGGSVQLTAMLFGADGLPLADTAVAFSYATKQFGPEERLVPLGKATTGTNGKAKLTYKPTVVGHQKFVASSVAAAEAKPVTAETKVVVTVAESAYHPAPPKPLADVGKVLVAALFAIVAAIWLTLAAQVVRVRRVCRPGRRPRVGSA